MEGTLVDDSECGVCGMTTPYGTFTWIRAVDNVNEDRDQDRWDFVVHTEDCLPKLEAAMRTALPHAVLDDRNRYYV